MDYKQIINKIPDDKLYWGGLPITILTDGNNNRWFLAPDISRVLGYSRYERAIQRHVSPDNMKRYGEIKDTIVSDIPKGLKDNFRFMSEKGLYLFIDSSKRKPYAKQLKIEYFD